MKLRPDNTLARFLRSLHVEQRSLRAIFLSAIILCCCRQIYGLNPSTRIDQYGHTVWHIGTNGLEGAPLSIAQTKDGYIWVGTADGLFRFDGVRFTLWTPKSGETLRGSYIVRLFGSRDGSLYIGTDVGLARITNGHVYNYTESLIWPGPFAEDSQGAIWMGDFENSGNDNTLCKVGKENLSCFGTKDGFDCINGTAIMSDKAGSVWIGSQEGICRWQQGKKPENFPLPYLSRPNMGYDWVHALASTGDGTLWAGIPIQGEGYGLLTFSMGKWRSYVTQGIDGTKLPVRFLLSDRRHSLWIGTRAKGLYRLNAGKLDHFDIADGLSGDTVRKMFEDREGDLWVVTDNGLDMFRDLPVITYTTRDGMPDNEALAIAAQDDGTVWVGARGALVRITNEGFSTITPKTGLPTSEVHELFRDSHNQLWVGGGQQLYLYKNDHFIGVRDHNRTELGEVTAMTEDRNHHLWVSVLDDSTGRGYILRIAASRVAARYGMFVPTNGQVPNALAPNPLGGLWVGSLTHGLFWFHNGAFERIDANLFTERVNRLSPDPDGGIWVIINEEGIYRYKGGKTQKLTSSSGLPCDTGYNVVDDHAGNHWFYMACGIVRVPDSELARWWRDPAYHFTPTLFGLIDGAEPRASEEPPVVTPDGRIWSVNNSPLQVIDPRHLPYNQVVPPLYVEDMVVDHKGYSASGTLRLPVSPREVQIDYTALSYVVPEKVKFRYRLSGYESEWTDAGTRRQAFYNNLRPGRYTFHAIACNNDGVWNRLGASITFTIPPAWYQTLWFRVFCSLLIALIAYAVYQSRLRRYSALLKARFDERIEERTRLARDLHDTLLQTLQGSKLVADNALEDSADPVRMRKALDLVSQWLERATLEGRAALNSLRSSTTKTNDLAAALCDAADSCYVGSNVTIAFVLNGTSRDMHPIVREEIYRIGCEAINNACVHSGASVVTIELTYTHDLLLIVRDNGRGIDEAILQFGKNGHFGMRGMRERADRIGGKLSLKTNPNSGTEVTLLVAGSVAFKIFNALKQSKRSGPFSEDDGSAGSE